MNGLRAALVSRFEELTGELLFHHKPDASADPTAAPQVINGSLEPPRAGSWEEAADYPFIRVALYTGSFCARMPLKCEAVAYAGIWTPGTVQDGDNDIFTLLTAMDGIVEQPRFTPWLLSEVVHWTVGLQDKGLEGMQRHPFHYGALFMEFTASRGASR